MKFEPATLDELIDIYGLNGEHPDYPEAQWQYEVGEGDTRRGYWDWVAANVEYDCRDILPL